MVCALWPAAPDDVRDYPSPNITPVSRPWLVQARLALGFLQDVATATSFSPARRRDAPVLRHHPEYWRNVRASSQPDLNGTGLTEHPRQLLPPCLNQGARLSAEKLSRPGGTKCPFIRRSRDFTRGDFQEENRELTIQGCTASAVPIR